MPAELDALLPDVKMRPPLPVEQADGLLTGFISKVGAIPHQDYLSFIREHNGCDGPVGREGYLALWPLEKVVSATERYQVAEFAPGLLLFGSDGGNEAFAFDRQDPRWPVVSVPLVGLSRKDMWFVAPTFSEFIRLLAADKVG